MNETVPSQRLQRLTAFALQALALLLFGLHLYVYLFLPPSPPNTVPDQGSVETAWWGLWPVQALSPWQVMLGGLALLGVIAYGWRAAGRRGGGDLLEVPSPPPGGLPAGLSAGLRPLLLPLITAALFAAFFLLPLAHTRWGDAFMLANGVAWPDPALRITHSWQAPLDVFLHSQVWAALHGPLGWEDAAPAYRLLSPVAGLLYLLAALALSRDLEAEPWRVPAWLTYGLLATLGLLQLFFGYVENYSFAAAGVLAYLWLGLRVLAGRQRLWVAATLLAVVNATHPSTVILAPSLLYLGWRCYAGAQTSFGAQTSSSAPPAGQTGTSARQESTAGRGEQTGTSAVQGRNYSWLAVVGEIALPMLLIGGATFVWMEASGHGLYALLNTDRPGGGDASWFVPLWETSTRWQRYTMFSWPHVRDWLNEQLLVAPVVLPALAVVSVNLWLARRDHRHVGVPAAPHEGVRTERGLASQGDAPHVGVRTGRGLAGDTVRFLLVAAGFYLLFTFVWNPDYGGQRDWDLFSLAALPPTVLLALLLPRALPDRRLLWAGAVPLLVLQGWHTWAWIVQNTLPWQWPE